MGYVNDRIENCEIRRNAGYQEGFFPFVTMFSKVLHFMVVKTSDRFFFFSYCHNLFKSISLHGRENKRSFDKGVKNRLLQFCRTELCLLFCLTEKLKVPSTL